MRNLRTALAGRREALRACVGTTGYVGRDRADAGQRRDHAELFVCVIGERDLTSPAACFP